MGSDRADALRVLLQPGATGSRNMQRDAALLDGDPIPTLRLYTWDPPAISVGYMQRPEELVDLRACREAAIDVVRRPTGGRAILHWEEVTYAIAASTRDARFGRSLLESHMVIGECLAAGLAHLGIEAQLSRPARQRGRHVWRRPCFASNGRAEILVGGRKLVGSAQRRTAGRFLQHGSLLLGSAHEHLVDFLVGVERPRREAMRDELHGATITLRELRGSATPFDVVAQALVRGFAARLGVRSYIATSHSPA